MEYHGSLRKNAFVWSMFRGGISNILPSQWRNYKNCTSAIKQTSSNLNIKQKKNCYGDFQRLKNCGIPSRSTAHNPQKNSSQLFSNYTDFVSNHHGDFINPKFYDHHVKVVQWFWNVYIVFQFCTQNMIYLFRVSTVHAYHRW